MKNIDVLPKDIIDFEDIKGQDHAKRAITVALAGMVHNTLLYGCHGTGKTMFLDALRSTKLLPEAITLVDNLDRLSFKELQSLEDKPFIATIKTCPCGYYSHPTKSCKCSPSKIVKFFEKIIDSGVLEHVEIFAELSILYARELEHPHKQQSTNDIIRQIKDKTDYKDLSLGKPSNTLLGCAYREMNLTPRQYDQIVRVARTVANLDCSEHIEVEHISEAIQYKNNKVGIF